MIPVDIPDILRRNQLGRTYSISELAEEFAVTTRTLRFYEDKGILSPERKGTARVYAERDRVRLRLALRGKRLGFSLDDCREIIELYDPIPGNKVRQLKRLQEKIAEHREVLLGKRADIDATLANMNEIALLCQQHLDDMQSHTPRSRNS
ncbi:MAG: MerR family DNA-binding transcriptional regulator [Gammaproteobacteria bacterium]|jgi:DNA-binding transcriptional MerR regulator|nr:MerR family DNA-binding transcriptional regulator [Gammaproteobacteria bacterium]